MVSGPYCTKIMADLGAEVIKIEPPVDGDPARQMPPFPGDSPHPEKSGLFFYLNTNKRGITLNPETPEGKQIFLKLIKTTDVLVEDHPPGGHQKHHTECQTDRHEESSSNGFACPGTPHTRCLWPWRWRELRQQRSRGLLGGLPSQQSVLENVLHEMRATVISAA